MNEMNRMQLVLKGLEETSKIEEFLYFEELQRRELYINAEVDDYLIDDVVKHILRWNLEDKDIPVDERTPIKLSINTYGGDLYTCLSIISVVKNSKTPVHTINLGKAMSAGALILIAGHKRFGYANSITLIHEGESGYMNTTSKTKDHFKFQEKLESRIKEFVVANTKMDSDTYDKRYKEELYILGDEALGFGILDELLD